MLRIVRKESVSFDMQAFRTYGLRVRYDGTSFTVSSVDGNGLISLPAKASHSGGFGFRTKGTTGLLSQVVAYSE